ncbi:transglutaminase family protein [Chloroflexota bacterium]
MSREDLDLVSMAVQSEYGRGMITSSDQDYLNPSKLCDFDRSSRIRARALELTLDCRNREEIYRCLFAFVKELPYSLDDWDVPASETLSRGWGMCSGKANLLVAMLRSLSIPARYRTFRIKAEVGLWKRIVEGEGMPALLGPAPPQQDHVDCEVWLGGWIACDPSRDTPLERGFSKLGIPLEREPVLDSSGNIPYLRLASFDEWAWERQNRRQFRQNRGEVFALVNERLWRIRAPGNAE